MKKAFTLIELLVVIAIIAILAAILFPVFAQAKAAAKKISSLSNTKNIAMGIQIYTTDVDDVLPMLQYVLSNASNPYDWYGWPRVVNPYIKNGQSKNATGGDLWGAEGIFRAPGDPTKQENGSYALHQDLARDGAAPWNGWTSTPKTFSTTAIDGIADKVYMIEKGINKGYAGWLQFATWEWGWVDYLAPDANGVPTKDTTFHASIQPNVGDCDLGYSASDTDSFGTWYGCGMYPRYRYMRNTPTAFLDGHAKTFARSQNATALSWYRNIYVREAYDFNPIY